MKCACAILSSVASPAVKYFRASSHKRRDFRGKKFADHKMFFDFLYSVCLKHFLF